MTNTRNCEEMNEMSVLLKYYIQKVVSKIKTSKKAQEKTAPLRKNRGVVSSGYRYGSPALPFWRVWTISTLCGWGQAVQKISLFSPGSGSFGYFKLPPNLARNIFFCN